MHVNPDCVIYLGAMEVGAWAESRLCMAVMHTCVAGDVISTPMHAGDALSTPITRLLAVLKCTLCEPLQCTSSSHIYALTLSFTGCSHRLCLNLYYLIIRHGTLTVTLR